jgi:hypothetical protein
MGETSRDMRILTHFDNHLYGSIEQIQKLFFEDTKSGYIIANRRLKKLKEMGYLENSMDLTSNRLIYRKKHPKVKPPSYHRVLILDAYSQLSALGYDVKYFKAEKEWLGGKFRSDGFIVINAIDRIYRFFMEVQLSNHDPNLSKYDELLSTGVVQKEFNCKINPNVLLISDKHYEDMNVNQCRIIQVPTNFNQLSKFLMEIKDRKHILL